MAFVVYVEVGVGFFVKYVGGEFFVVDYNDKYIKECKFLDKVAIFVIVLFTFYKSEFDILVEVVEKVDKSFNGFSFWPEDEPIINIPQEPSN